MSSLAVAHSGVGNAASALRRTTEACAAWRQASAVYASLARDRRLREDQRELEWVQQHLASCPK
jgi:hypothetical protein